MPLAITIGLLIVAGLIIYVACEGFVNGIEWLGRKLGFGHGATGALLAALGTALPETIIALVATAFGKNASDAQIGIGTVLGSTLVLSTLVIGMIGLSAVAIRGKNAVLVVPDAPRLARSQVWFLGVFVALFVAGQFIFPGKWLLGFGFLALYGWFFKSWLDKSPEDEQMVPEPLLLQKKAAEPTLSLVILQVALAVGAIFAASELFVHELDNFAEILALPSLIVALFLSPAATELPEAIATIIWVRRGHERMAMANIIGAMMIQATVPTALCLFFTPWRLDRPAMMSAVVTIIAALCLLPGLRSGKLRAAGVAQLMWLYILFAGLVVFWP